MAHTQYDHSVDFLGSVYHLIRQVMYSRTSLIWTLGRQNEMKDLCMHITRNHECQLLMVYQYTAILHIRIYHQKLKVYFHVIVNFPVMDTPSDQAAWIREVPL